MKETTTNLFHVHATTCEQLLGLGLFLKLYNGQTTTAVAYINTANTLQPIRILLNGPGKRDRRCPMVKRMTMRAKMKQME